MSHKGDAPFACREAGGETTCNNTHPVKLRNRRGLSLSQRKLSFNDKVAPRSSLSRRMRSHYMGAFCLLGSPRSFTLGLSDKETVKTRKQKYKNYIRSEHWKRRKRKYYKKNPGRRCWICGSTRDVELHHKTYKRLKKEQDSDLVPLCRKCHKAVHDRYKIESLYHPSTTLWKVTQIVKDEGIGSRGIEKTYLAWDKTMGCRQCGWPHGPFENGLCRQCVRNGVNKGVYLDSRGQVVC